MSICPRVHLSSCPGVPSASSRAPGPYQLSRYLTVCLPVLGFLFHFLFLSVSVPHLSVEGSQLSRRHGSPAWVALEAILFLPLSPLMSLSPEHLQRCTCSFHFTVPTDGPYLCSPSLPSCGWPSGSCVRFVLRFDDQMPLPQEDGPLSRLSFPLLFTPFIPQLPPLLCASLLPFPHLTLSSTQGLHLLKGRRLLQPFIQEGLNLLEPVVHEQGGVHPGNRGPFETCAP